MGRCKDGIIGCRQCGITRDIREWLSLTGLCPSCGETNLVEWEHGMTDPQSVVRKIWQASRDVAILGRPRRYTPSPGQISNLRLK